MERVSQEISDLFGLIYRNLIRDDEDPVVHSTSSRNAVLAVLLRRGSLPMNAIAEHLRVSKANMTFLVDKLEESGLTQRERSLEDRRKIHVSLTAKGRRLIENEHANRIRTIGSRLGSLDRSELEELHDSVVAVTRLLRKLAEPAVDAEGDA